jgi:N-acetyl-anhydromuramyl-L-alanine amidase AmpD
MTATISACSRWSQSDTAGRIADRLRIALPLAFCCSLAAAAGAEPIRARRLPSSATHLPSPDVQWIASPNVGSRNGPQPIDSIVIHTTETTFSHTLEIFQDTTSQVSAHFVIAPSGHIVQMVDTANRAWHATYYNSRSIGIEMVGYANQPSTWNDHNLKSLVELLAWLVTAYDIPLVHPTGNAYDFPNDEFNQPGLVAHGQVQPWNRTDPGPYFPWSQVLSATQARIIAVPEPSAVALAALVLATLFTNRRWRLSAAEKPA